MSKGVENELMGHPFILRLMVIRIAFSKNSESRAILSGTAVASAQNSFLNIPRSRNTPWAASFRSSPKMSALGIFSQGTLELKRTFLASAISNFRTMADIFGIAMARFRLQQERDTQLLKGRELDIAADMQNRLLPIHPQASYQCGDAWTYRNAVESVAGRLCRDLCR